MTRAQFLALFALPFMAKHFRKEKKPSEWALKYAKAFYESSIRKYPLTENECFRVGNDGSIITNDPSIAKVFESHPMNQANKTKTRLSN